MNATAEILANEIASRVQLLSEAIVSRQDFQQAIRTLALYKIASELHALDREIVQAFVEAHRGQTFASPDIARQSVEGFRARSLNRLADREVS